MLSYVDLAHSSRTLLWPYNFLFLHNCRHEPIQGRKHSIHTYISDFIRAGTSPRLVPTLRAKYCTSQPVFGLLRTRIVPTRRKSSTPFALAAQCPVFLVNGYAGRLSLNGGGEQKGRMARSKSGVRSLSLRITGGYGAS